MKCCLNCSHYLGNHTCQFSGRYIPHPLFQGGKKCECYQKPKKYVLKYPTKEQWGNSLDKE